MHATLLTMMLLLGHGHTGCPHHGDAYCSDLPACSPASLAWSNAWRKRPAVRPRYRLRGIPHIHGNPYRDSFDYRTQFQYPWFLEPHYPLASGYGSAYAEDGLIWPPGIEAPLPLPADAVPPLPGDPRIKRVTSPAPRPTVP